MIYVHISYEVYIYRMICEISNFSGIFVHAVKRVVSGMQSSTNYEYRQPHK